MTEETLEVRAYQEYLHQRAMWNRSKAEQGDADAQYNLGWTYYHGDGVVQDFAEAVRWWRLAAEQGDAWAQYYLGEEYRRSEDDAEAVRWFRLAAEQGHARAQFSLGMMYDSGWGVEQDHVEAERWFRLADEQVEYLGDIAMPATSNNCRKEQQDE